MRCAFQFTNCPCGRYISVSNQAITCCKSLQELLPIPNSDSACTISRAGETRKRARAGAELGKENERFILFIHIELPREREREQRIPLQCHSPFQIRIATYNSGHKSLHYFSTPLAYQIHVLLPHIFSVNKTFLDFSEVGKTAQILAVRASKFPSMNIEVLFSPPFTCRSNLFLLVSASLLLLPHCLGRLHCTELTTAAGV